MPTLHFEGEELDCEPGESVLTCLERSGVPIASSCRAGVCQSCLLQATSGPVPPAAQAGLNPAWQALGYLLACACRPTEDLTLQRPGDGALTAHTTVVAREQLSDDVVGLRLARPEGFTWRAGQFVHLVRDDGLSRPYSLASVPELDDVLELHVRRVPGGRMTGWIHDTLAPGDAVQLRGPAGTCIYTGSPDQALVLVGLGTGLAPLLGIVRDALHRGHQGTIHLLHGSRVPSGLYLLDRLHALERDHHPRLRVVPVALDAQGRDDVVHGDIREVLGATVPSLDGARVYLCGDPPLVNALKRQVFLAGASLSAIHADPFLGAADALR